MESVECSAEVISVWREWNQPNSCYPGSLMRIILCKHPQLMACNDFVHSVGLLCVSHVCLNSIHSWIELRSPPQQAHVTIKRSNLGLALHLKTSSQTTCPKGWNLIPICVGETKWATSKLYPSDNTQISSFAVMSLSHSGSKVGKSAEY